MLYGNDINPGIAYEIYRIPERLHVLGTSFWAGIPLECSSNNFDREKFDQVYQQLKDLHTKAEAIAANDIHADYQEDFEQLLRGINAVHDQLTAPNCFNKTKEGSAATYDRGVVYHICVALQSLGNEMKELLNVAKAFNNRPNFTTITQRDGG